MVTLGSDVGKLRTKRCPRVDPDCPPGMFGMDCSDGDNNYVGDLEAAPGQFHLGF